MKTLKQDFVLKMALLIIAILMIGIFTLPSMQQNAQAAPPAAPTPVGNVPSESSTWKEVNLQSTTAITEDTNTTGQSLQLYEYVDIQYVIDQTDVNTTTLTVQYSNDNTNWVSGLALVSSSVADGSDITRVPIFGRYLRVNQNVTNTNPITITIKGLAK